MSRRFGLMGIAAALAAASCLALAHPQSKRVESNPRVEIVVAGRGRILAELFPREAPKTVSHFLDLVNRHFYDGLLFHRVVPSFVVQAGDTASRALSAQEVSARDDHNGGTSGLGSGGSGQNGANQPVVFESSDRTNEPGTIALALSAPRSATGDSQFFINLQPNHMLDGDYCVFGRVLPGPAGLDIVKKLKRGDRITRIGLIPRK